MPGSSKGDRARNVAVLREAAVHDEPGVLRGGPRHDYGQARYLCYYLQERGLLEEYYHAFVANHDRDPTGLETLKAVIRTDDVKRFQREWETFVSGLRFRG